MLTADQPQNSVPPVRHPFLNAELPSPYEVDPDVLEAAGISRKEYGTPNQAVATYMRMLCDEPDIEDAHPIARRIICHGSKPNTFRINPERAAYIKRRKKLQREYIAAGRRRKLSGFEFRDWYVEPLSHNGITPRQICIEGGVAYARLVAEMLAIVNMLDGGWPVRHLLGIEEEWLRRRQARQYNKPDAEGGGPHPFLENTHRRCASYTMMRKGLSYIEILVAMCDRVFDTTEAAGAFLSTPNHRIANTTPMHFVRDIPTLQRCIDLMPADPKLTDLNGKTYKRIW